MDLCKIASGRLCNCLSAFSQSIKKKNVLCVCVSLRLVRCSVLEAVPCWLSAPCWPSSPSSCPAEDARGGSAPWLDTCRWLQVGTRVKRMPWRTTTTFWQVTGVFCCFFFRTCYVTHLCRIREYVLPRAFETSHLSPGDTRAPARTRTNLGSLYCPSVTKTTKKKGQKETNSRTAAARQLESAWYLQDLGWMDVEFAVKGQLFLLYTGHWFGAAYDLAGHWLFAKTGHSSSLVNKARLCQSFKTYERGKSSGHRSALAFALFIMCIRPF